MALVSVQVEVHDTESKEAVEAAVHGIFPDVVLSGDPLSGQAKDMDRFAKILLDHQIRDSARSHLNGAIEGSIMEFYLSKQAACVGKINFSEGTTPLGDIHVRVEGDDLVEFIGSITGTEAEQ